MKGLAYQDLFAKYEAASGQVRELQEAMERITRCQSYDKAKWIARKALVPANEEVPPNVREAAERLSKRTGERVLPSTRGVPANEETDG